MKNKTISCGLFILYVAIATSSYSQTCKQVLAERVINDTNCIHCYLIPLLIQTEDDSVSRGLVESKSLYRFFRSKGFSFDAYKTKMSLILAEYQYRPISYKEYGTVPPFIDAPLKEKHKKLLKASTCKEDVMRYFQKTQVQMHAFSVEELKDLVFEIWKWGIGIKLRDTDVIVGFNCLGLFGG